MRKLIVISAVAAALIFSMGVGEQDAYAQMTDSAVIEYVKTSIKNGKSYEQIGRSLLEKGATPEQIKRLKKKLEDGVGFDELSSSSSRSKDSGNDSYKPVDRNRDKDSDKDPEMDEDMMDFLEMASTMDDEETDGKSSKKKDKEKKPEIYGHSIFNSRFLSFEPNENVATPTDYKLGPGDEVIIEIWGASETTIRQIISPEGRINISGIGPVNLSGLTIAAAQWKVRQAASKKYAGIGSQTQLSLTLGSIRTISVNVMGEAKTPGTYRLSPFATVFTALYRAGGVTDIGSLRNIKVMRDGKQIATVDIYKYIFDGYSKDDITLREGDIIIVPSYEILVDVTGKVKRPMLYELKPYENAAKLIEYAGGFSGDAFTEAITVVNRTGKERMVSTVKESSFGDFRFRDQDSVSVWENPVVYSNRVDIEGAVYRPGSFQLGGDIATVRQLVEHADGLLPEAFMERAILVRTPENKVSQVIPVDIAGIMAGTVPDIVLQRDDVLKIFDVQDVTVKGTIKVEGSVMEPGEFEFMENTTVEDAILLCGGLQDGASTARVDIYRRVVDPAGKKAENVVSHSFSMSLRDGFYVGGDDFLLEPFDVVVVRNSPGYKTQGIVTLEGEVEFAGTYALETKTDRLSDLVRRAGGLTDFAYVKGASLVRKKVDSETTALSEDRFGKKADKDSLEAILSDTYIVGIDLEKALEEPGSQYDMTLKDGDNIIIPEYDGTVKILGAVMSENAVPYIKGKSVHYYIDHAGGYAEGASRSKVYVMYMNGSVVKSRAGMKVEPGAIIYVPKRAERTKMSGAEIISMGSTATSLATIMLYLVSLVRSLR
ncbi:MAG: SLBB domain-containing protein [Bacteroidales bacterium]|nr:SLBB domain-containing protein [Bacteroidales bacterium]